MCRKCLILLLLASSARRENGEGGIRTLGRIAPTPVFETGPFGRSGTSPSPGLAAGWLQWSGGGSNSQPSHCERDALPVELPPLIANQHYMRQKSVRTRRGIVAEPFSVIPLPTARRTSDVDFQIGSEAVR